jgi:hypothetical protein
MIAFFLDMRVVQLFFFFRVIYVSPHTISERFEWLFMAVHETAKGS